MSFFGTRDLQQCGVAIEGPFPHALNHGNSLLWTEQKQQEGVNCFSDKDALEQERSGGGRRNICHRHLF